ncbi:MAG: MlaD family protein [Geminicoccaceae bacterium]
MLPLVGWLALVVPAQAQEPQPLPPGLAEKLVPALLQRLDAARAGPDAALPPGVPFRIRFTGEVGEIAPGTPVTVRGIPVGQVRDVAITFDSGSGVLDVPVTIELVPERIVVDGVAPGTPAATEAAVATLVARGLRARIAAAGLFGGTPRVVLDLAPDAAPAGLGRDGDLPLIPSLPTRADELRASLDALVARIGALPLERLAGQAEATLAGVNALVTGPELKAVLADLVAAAGELKGVAGRLETRADPLIASLARTSDAAGAAIDQGARTLGQLDATLGARAPVWTQLQALLRELTAASRALRLMSEYLERHPDALIRGKAEQGP